HRAHHGRRRRLGDPDAGAAAGHLQRIDPAPVHGGDQPAEELEVHHLLAVAPESDLPLHRGTLRLLRLRTLRVLRGLGIHRLTRSRYLSSRRSTRITSPSFRKSGTCTVAPVSSFAGLVPPCAVSPLTPGSVSTIASSTK